MRITYLMAAALFVIVAAIPLPCFGLAAAATDDRGQNPATAAAAPSADPRAGAGGETPAAEDPAPPARIWLVLKGGAKIEAEEVSEKPDGFWFRRGNIWALLDHAKVERIERESPAEKAAAAAPKAEPARWSLSDAARVESYFVKRFGRTLPVTAFGQSELHSRCGYDHRDSMDIGLHPDSPEGRALMAFLSGEGLPFMIFRRAIPGVASAPHIHVGLPSRRLTAR